MTTEHEGETDPVLERHFAAAREETPAMPDALMARLLAQAAEQQPPASAVPAVPAAARGALWRQVLATLGGWPAAAGLAASACAGLWIGLSPPVALEAALGAGAAETSSLVDPIGAFDLLLVEG